MLGTLAQGGSNALDAAGLNSEFFTKELNANNNWTAAWQNLPVAAKQGGNIVDIEYRVVETKIGDIEIDQPTNAAESFVYKTEDGKDYHPYQPKQTSWTHDDGKNSFATAVKNTLEGTSISATKTWAGDTVDGTQDAWGVRPSSDGTWSVTFLLQRKLTSEDETSWQWLMKYGAGQATIDDPDNGQIVSETITGSSSVDSASATWSNLPRTDAEGRAYAYRVVERVPGGYDVTDQSAEAICDADGNPITAVIDGVTYRYYVVDSSEGAQSYTNTLRTLDLTGTKLWEDFDTDLAPEFDASKAPTMTLYRATKKADGSWNTAEQVKMKDGKLAAQPKWTAGSDGAWTFTYENLPAADKNDNPYTYWAVETAGSGGTGGFYPVYGTGASQSDATHGASGTTVTESGKQTNETITNTATRLSLAKVSDWHGADGASDPETLAGITLAVQSRDGNTTYATWTNGPDGNTYSTATWVNGTSNTSDATGMVQRGDNLIAGLKAGKYKIVETSTPPAGYAQAPDVLFTINADGTATYNGVELDGVTNPDKGEADVKVDTKTGIHTITVTAEDPVLRGHLELTKYVSEDGETTGQNANVLEGAKFDLYRVDMDGDGKDELIVSGLTTGEDGKISTAGNGATINKLSSDGTDLTYGGKYTTLADGLPEGDYYFKETDAGPTAVTPSGDDAKTETLTINQDNHYAYTNAPVSKEKGNESFTSKVELVKYDTTSQDGINGAEFNLKYRPEGTSGDEYPVNLGTFTTKHDDTLDKDGVLVLDNLEKGDYLLTETKNDGYDISGDNAFLATFTIDNEDYNQTYNLNTEDGQTAVDFTEAEGSVAIETGKGVPNDRILGSVTLTKTDATDNAKPLNGVTFKLEREIAGDKWEQVTAQTFETGKSYTLDDANETATEVPLSGDAATAQAGKLSISNLWWGTYRFTEVGGLDGYVEGHNNGDVHSKEFTIDARNGEASTNLTASMTNAPTKFEVQKVDSDGNPLQVAGVTFLVKPVAGSSFVDATMNKQGLTMTTDSTGLARLDQAQLILGNTYTLQETAAPEGYKKLSGTIEFKANDGSEQDKPAGSISITKAVDGFSVDSANAAGTRLNVQNDPISLMLTKLDANGDAVPNVKFQLSGDGYATSTQTTGDDGKITLSSGLKAGVQYTLVETSAPDGFTYLDPFTFSFNEYGQIIADGNVDGWKVADNQLSITAINQFTDLTIKKYSNEADPDQRTPLAGAEFTVKPAEGTDSAFVDGASAKTLKTKMNADKTVASDSLTGQLIVGNSYTIEETKAPDGYTKIEGAMTVTVQDDGSLQITDGTTAPADFIIGQDGVISVFTGDVTNTPTEMTLAKIDADTNRPVSGAQFSLSGTFADGTATQPLNVTSEDGRITLDKALLIADGKTEYTLTETGAPNGFETLPPMKFTVSEKGAITPISLADGWSVDDDGVTITAADTPVKIILIKNGADGETNLNGAVFDLYEGDAAIGDPYRSETTQNGSISFDYLIAERTYTLVERIAPTGYELMSEPVTFTVGTDGRVAFVNPTAAANAGYTQSHDDATGVVTITATDHPVEITLAKNGSDGANGLNGAVFDLYAGETASGKPARADLETKDDGSVKLDKLTGGATYTLHEKSAPNGYKLMGDVTFTVGIDGEVTLKNADANNNVNYTVASKNGVVTITATDEPIAVQLNKRDLGGGSLAGAEFDLSGKFVNDTTHVLDKDSRTLAVTMSGDTVTLDGLTGGDSATYSLVAGQQYTLVETRAPSGYETLGKFTFKVNEDGTITSDGVRSDDTKPGYVIEDGAIAITAHDQPIEIAVAKKAKGENGQTLHGAEFLIKPADGSAFANPDNNDGIIVTTSNARQRLSGQLIAGNSYVITETKAPAGYKVIAGSFTFTVKKDGTIAKVGGNGVTNDDAFAITGDGKVTIAATDTPVEVKLNKVGVDGAKLDATFTLTGTFADESMNGAADAEESTRRISVTDGKAALDRLIVGNTYTLRETKAQAGYEVIVGTLTFTVNADGTITAAEGVTNDDAYAIGPKGMAITATDTPVEIEVAKVNEAGTALTDAKFTLKGDLANADGTVKEGHVWSLTSDTQPTAVTGLIATNDSRRHEYTLTETAAPAGYEKLGTLKFTVNSDGTINIVSDDTTDVGYTVDGNQVRIVAKDTPIRVRLAKTDANNTPLPDATFEIAPGLNSAFSDGGKGAKEFTTGVDGTVMLDEAWLVAGNTYTITETAAPNGYELAGTVSFTVKSDGTIALIGDDGQETAAATGAVNGKDGSGAYLATGDDGNGIVTITATDNPIVVQLFKSDGTRPLAGAQFSLTPAEGSAFADGTIEPQTLSMGATGLTALPNLTAGATYMLKETAAPAGYELIATEFTFTVGKNGTITPTEGSMTDGYAVTDRGVVTITATDKPIEVELRKVNTDGKLLPNAEFTVEGIFAVTDGDGKMTGAAEQGVSKHTFTADETGTVAIDRLVAGQRYTLTEIKAPEGYRVNTTPYTFTVNADGMIAETGTVDGYAVTDKNGVAVVTATDQPTELGLVKLSVGGNQTPLAGAEFTLVPDTQNDPDSRFLSGAEPIRLVTDENGMIPTVTNELLAGHAYVLEETKAPAGYERITQRFHFTVGAKGRDIRVTEGTERPAAYTVGNTNGVIVITAADTPLEVSFVKQSTSGELLAGAEFTIAPADTDMTFPDGETTKTFVSDANGVVFDKLMLTGSRKGVAYTITETKAPGGYELAEPVTILVFADGTVEFGPETPKDVLDHLTVAQREDGVAALTLRDEPIELNLKKVDEQGDALAGAEFTITGRFADGETSKTVTSGKDGVAALPAVIGGERYTLVESKAPDGYVTLTERYGFTVSVDGVIVAAQEAGTMGTATDAAGQRSAYTLSADGLTITIVNKAKPPLSITGSPVIGVGMLAFGLLLIGAALATQWQSGLSVLRSTAAHKAGSNKSAGRGRHRR